MSCQPQQNMQQQHSIFEPLFSSQLASSPSNIMELMASCYMAGIKTPEQAFISQHAPPHSWFIETPPPSTTCIGIRRASCSSPPFVHSHHTAPIVSSHFPIPTSSCAKLSSSSTTSTRNEQELPLPDCSFPKACDDGSVASKLLSSITKSISSPSLHLPCSKEAARETPYQKSLKLKHMKLQHCAEALGMESSDSSSSAVGDDIITQSQLQVHAELDPIDSLSICPSITNAGAPLKISNQEYSLLPTMKSAPNLSAPPMMMPSQRPKYRRCTSFPPPLSHTLPASPYCDSPSLSLRPYRQDGRLILKEVMVPSKNYFSASRKDGRLTLHILTRDLDEEQDEQPASQYHQQGLTASNEICELEHATVEEEGMQRHMKGGMVSLECPYEPEEAGSCGNFNIVDEDASLKAGAHSLNLQLLTGDATKLPNAAKVVTVKSFCIAAHGDRDRYANSDIAATSNLLNPKRMQCSHAETHGPGPRLGGLTTMHVESNIVSNVIAALTSLNSKLTLPKVQILNCLQTDSSSYPLSSGTILNQSTVIHPPGKSHSLPASSHHDMSTFAESKENFIWESNLLVPCMSISRHKAGIGRGENGSNFGLEELEARSLMKMVAGLATVGVACDVRDWCTLANGKKQETSEASNINNLSDAWPSDLDSSTGILAAEAYNGLSSFIMGRGSSNDGQADQYTANHDNARLVSSCHHDEEKAGINIGLEAAGKEVLSASSLYSSSASSTPTPPIAYLQSDEWVHTLHCKELSGRNQFGIYSFMQPHSSCIATRS